MMVISRSCGLTRLSRTVTSCSNPMRRWVSAVPMNPLPPTTSTFIAIPFRHPPSQSSDTAPYCAAATLVKSGSIHKGFVYVVDVILAPCECSRVRPHLYAQLRPPYEFQHSFSQRAGILHRHEIAVVAFYDRFATTRRIRRDDR